MPLTISVRTIGTGGMRTIAGGQESLGAGTATTIITNGQYTVCAARQCRHGRDSARTLKQRSVMPKTPYAVLSNTSATSSITAIRGLATTLVSPPHPARGSHQSTLLSLTCPCWTIRMILPIAHHQCPLTYCRS
jgi:hypothetical protein